MLQHRIAGGILMMLAALLQASCGGGADNTANPGTSISSSSSSGSSSSSTTSGSPSDIGASSSSGSSGSPPAATAPPITTGRYRVTNRASGLMLDIADESIANGGKVHQWDYTGGMNQQFDIVRLSSGHYSILAAHSGKSLDVWNRNTTDGGEIRQYDYSGEQHQQWNIDAVDDDYYRIVARSSGLALTVEDYSNSGGAEIRQMTWRGDSSQQWRFERIPEKEYTLVWSDEFNGSGLPDTSVWSYEEGMVRNNEDQYYTVARPENVNIANGLLTITARRESYQGAAYTSASLHTRGKIDWTYGRFEIRARIDTRAGMWPAFWTLGNGKWPECGEVDIMEFYQDKLLANVAWKADNSDAWSAAWDSSTRPLSGLRTQDPDWANKFHVWRMDWDSQSIRLYVDDVLMNSTDLSNTVNPDGVNPFVNRPMYMLINLAIGGNNGGDPSGTAFPAIYEIDYVRVYQ